jgi:hypothetical protein
MEMYERLPNRIGFLVAEGLDFGSAKKTDALYSSLLELSPFSTKEQRTYDELLSDRNLVVHYGGALTHSYLRQRLGLTSTDKAFQESITINIEYLDARYAFLFTIVDKIIISCHATMSRRVADHELELTDGASNALGLLNLWESSWGDLEEY